MTLITTSELLARLRQAVDDAGGVDAWAKANGFSARYVTGILNGPFQLGTQFDKTLLAKLGVVPVAAWEVPDA